ncbi:hypothetical protein E4O76_12150 [Neisseria meningitidis]|nr:hypothetical protein [Neisseria meningitidis]
MPAFAGRTAERCCFSDKFLQYLNSSFPNKNRNLKSRHSRAGGNPVCSVSVFPIDSCHVRGSRFPLSRE